MRPSLTVWLCLLPYLVMAQAVKSLQLRIRQPTTFEKLTADLDASQLLQRYRANLKLRQVRHNRHEPAVKDSILAVATATDRLALFKNRYNALLLSATFTYFYQGKL